MSKDFEFYSDPDLGFDADLVNVTERGFEVSTPYHKGIIALVKSMGATWSKPVWVVPFRSADALFAAQDEIRRLIAEADVNRDTSLRNARNSMPVLKHDPRPPTDWTREETAERRKIWNDWARANGGNLPPFEMKLFADRNGWGAGALRFAIQRHGL